MRVIRNEFKISIGKPEAKRPLWRHRHRWEDNIKIEFERIRCEGVAWIHLPLDTVQWWTVVSMVMNLWVPWKVGNVLTS
jgi:hypothetical protein